MFIKLLDQRIALQEEYHEIMNSIIWLISSYDQLRLVSGFDDTEQRVKLVRHINELFLLVDMDIRSG